MGNNLQKLYKFKKNIQKWSIHTVDSYSSQNRKEILTSATAWMNLEGTMLNKPATIGQIL